MSCLRFLIPFLLMVGQANAGPAEHWAGIRSNLSEPEVAVVRSESAWQALWSGIGREPPMPLPDGRMAVAVLAGQRPSGGYHVDIRETEVRGCLQIVRYAERGPGSDQAVTKMLTAPWAVALLPVTARPVVFEREGAEERPLRLPAEEGRRLAQLGEICAPETRK